MKNILFLVKSKKSSSTRDRVTEYFRFFKNKKIDTAILHLSDNRINYFKTLILVYRYDVVFIQRKLLPIYFFWLIRILSKKIVFDFDDSIFLKTDGKYSKTRNKRFNYICKNSDLILAGNKFLLDHAKKNNTNSCLIPTCLDTKKYINKTNTKNLNLVWIGSKSTSKYLLDIIPAIEPIAEKIKNLELINISDVRLKSKILKIKNINWSIKNQYHYLSKGNIGLAPLSEDNWSKGKCSFKVLQYLATGIPVISSNYGMNKEILKDNQLGYLVKNKSDWAKYIFLINKENNYQKYRIASKAFIKDFDLNNNFKKIYILLKTL